MNLFRQLNSTGTSDSTKDTIYFGGDLDKSKSAQSSDSVKKSSDVNSTCDSSNIDCKSNNFIDSAKVLDYLRPIVVLGIGEDDAKDMMRWFIKEFFIKYETANFENIKKLNKFENALLNFIGQMIESNKFKKNFGQYSKVVEKESISQSLLLFLVTKELISIKDNSIVHNDHRIKEKKEIFESLC